MARRVAIRAANAGSTMLNPDPATAARAVTSGDSASKPGPPGTWPSHRVVAPSERAPNPASSASFICTSAWWGTKAIWVLIADSCGAAEAGFAPGWETVST